MSEFNLQVNHVESDIITDPSTNEKIHISTFKLPFSRYGSNYETMVFGGKLDDYKKLYPTLEQAHEGHKQAIALVYESFKEQD